MEFLYFIWICPIIIFFVLYGLVLYKSCFWITGIGVFAHLSNFGILLEVDC